MGLGGIIGGAGAIIGGISGSKAAKSAAAAQEAAARESLALQREQFDQTRADLNPFRESGTTALQALMFELGLGPAPVIGGGAPQIEEFTDTIAAAGGGFTPRFAGDRDPNQQAFQIGSGRNEGQIGFRSAGPTSRQRFRVGDQVFDSRDAAQQFADANPTGGTTFNGIQASPAALFALEQGRDTIEAGAAARGGLNSGATLAGLEKLRFGLSAQDRENQLNRFAGLVDSGQGAAGQQAVAGNAFAAQGANSLGNIGNAQSAGIIGANNAFQNAFSNIAGVAGFQNGGSSGGNSFGNLASLFSGPAPGSANAFGGF